MAKTKAEDAAVRDTWATLATHAARVAVDQVGVREYEKAERAMEWVDKWLHKAGGRSTSWRYRRPE